MPTLFPCLTFYSWMTGAAGRLCLKTLVASRRRGLSPWPRVTWRAIYESNSSKGKAPPFPAALCPCSLMHEGRAEWAGRGHTGSPQAAGWREPPRHHSLIQTQGTAAERPRYVYRREQGARHPRRAPPSKRCTRKSQSPCHNQNTRPPHDAS